VQPQVEAAPGRERETRDFRRAVALESVQQQVEAVEAAGRPEIVKTRDELLAFQPQKKNSHCRCCERKS